MRSFIQPTTPTNRICLYPQKRVIRNPRIVDDYQSNSFKNGKEVRRQNNPNLNFQ